MAPASYMRGSHMQLLIEWRDEAVREGERTLRAFNGKTYDMSLTRTCLTQCHTNRNEFCDRCHDYAGVSDPYCWRLPQRSASRGLAVRRRAMKITRKEFLRLSGLGLLARRGRESRPRW